MIPHSETTLPKSVVAGSMNTSESKRPAAKNGNSDSARWGHWAMRAEPSPLWRQGMPFNT